MRLSLRRILGHPWILGLVAAIAARSGLSCQQDLRAPLVLRLSRVGNSLVRIDEAGREADTILRSGAGALWLPTISPTGRLAAVVDLGAEGAEGRLAILDGRGTVLRSVGRNVQAYDWCGEDDRIAFVTGIPREDGEPPFLPTGLFLLDVSTGSIQRVPAPDGVYSVAWASFDSALYMKVGRRRLGESVYRIDLESKRVQVTPYYDFHFSPSGRFYLFYNKVIDSLGYGWKVVERTTGQGIVMPQGLGSIEGWASSQGDYLSFVRPRDSQPPLTGRPFVRTPAARAAVVRALYDVAGGTVISQVSGDVLAGLIEARNTKSLVVSGELRALRPPPNR